MGESLLPSINQWGHGTAKVTPERLLAAVAEAAERSLRNFEALPDGPEPCGLAPGYFRAAVEIPLTPELADQLMNGATGYRAHYAVSVELGESFNRELLEAVAPLVIAHEELYRGMFDADFCRRSLLGRFSKFWYPKEITDPSAQDELLKYKPVIKHGRWVAYWETRSRPCKGLLAPVSEGSAVLLNGTFISTGGQDFEQKKRRSDQIYETGWT